MNRPSDLRELAVAGREWRHMRAESDIFGGKATRPAQKATFLARKRQIRRVKATEAGFSPLDRVNCVNFAANRRAS
jgi:hypothetical protein